MIVPNQLVEVKVIGKTVKHYKSLGYDAKCGDAIDANVSHLTKGSHVKIKVQCDNCKKTSLKKYGTYWAMQNPEIALKSKASWMNKNNEKCSKQQNAVFKLLQDIYIKDKAELNYLYRSFTYDIALFLDEGIKIDIEYDGWYRHKDQQKDRKRDEISKKYGWKILRIKSGHKLPTKEQLRKAINKLINGFSYTQIVLDDWKEEDIS